MLSRVSGSCGTARRMRRTRQGYVGLVGRPDKQGRGVWCLRYSQNNGMSEMGGCGSCDS